MHICTVHGIVYIFALDVMQNVRFWFCVGQEETQFSSFESCMIWYDLSDKEALKFQLKVQVLFVDIIRL